jgi:hypothetical protein
VRRAGAAGLVATLHVALLLVAASGAGCSVVVAPEDVVVLCEQARDAPDPCPLGLRCVEGRCVAPADGCVPADVESCNGEDDNCNGFVDEGVDGDGDGFTFCGTQRGEDGGFLAGPTRAEFVDCDDSNRDVYPNAPDECDGRVNRCPASGLPDDQAMCEGALVCISGRCVDPMDCTAQPSLCASTELCDPGTLRCVETTCTPSSCGAGERCDPGSGSCVALTPLGDACNVDTECASGLCFARAALGLPQDAQRGVCGSACCEDAQCGAAGGGECVRAVTGARTCLPAGRAGTLGVPTSTTRLCSSFGGLSCLGESSAECRSDATGRICSFTAFASCVDGAVYRCGTPCESGADCMSDERCQYTEAGNTWLGRCTNLSVGAPAGAACFSNDACRDGACIEGRCAAPCCTDADCAGGRCLPSAAGGGFLPMRCRAAPPPF